jgi:hypothetical protein
MVALAAFVVVPDAADATRTEYSRYLKRCVLGGSGSGSVQTTTSTMEPSSRTSLARAMRVTPMYCTVAIQRRLVYGAELSIQASQAMFGMGFK